jgi:hypothetical protein
MRERELEYRRLVLLRRELDRCIRLDSYVPDGTGTRGWLCVYSLAVVVVVPSILWSRSPVAASPRELTAASSLRLRRIASLERRARESGRSAATAKLGSK